MESGSGYVSKNQHYVTIEDFTVSINFANDTTLMDTDIGKFSTLLKQSVNQLNEIIQFVPDNHVTVVNNQSTTVHLFNPDVFLESHICPIPELQLAELRTAQSSMFVCAACQTLVCEIKICIDI